MWRMLPAPFLTVTGNRGELKGTYQYEPLFPPQLLPRPALLPPGAGTPVLVVSG